MSCQSCGRPGFELCAGCRTITRLKNLWCSLQPSDAGLGLSLLRECAGALTDVAEARGGSGAQAPKEAGGRSRTEVREGGDEEKIPGITGVKREDQGGADQEKEKEEALLRQKRKN